MIRAVVALGVVAGLAGCTSSGSSGGSSGGNVLSNLFFYGGTTVPPAAAANAAEFDCPAIDVFEGGAALQSYAGGRTGDYEGLRHQISLGNLARECTVQADGSVLVRVGVEGRVLMGPAGGTGGRFDAPVRIVVRSGSQVLAQRARRVPVSVPSGDTQGTFTVVEEGIVVPARIGENFEILVGLGGASAAEPRPRRRG
ncbi:hypothetical protein [Salinarimonas soli]|uniref:Lipoprotein n=1 Tax=Salinarimonas soli TaxID=1638099 RepID=A0A5B2V5B3_9HYPH|nr:hypothetical protein [Salinarimonas soli]KAA2234111.1 hypothetical protein F0L46_24375 [Salinarimonas soli]